MIIKQPFYSKESVVLKEVLTYTANLLFKLEQKPIVLTDFDKALYLK
jgi:hypothetical protein